MLDSLCNMMKEIDGKIIYIYGAKGQPWYVYNYLCLKGVTVCGFVVTSLEGNPSNVDGLPVVSVDKYEWDENTILLVSFQFRSNHFNNIIHLLIERGIKNVMFIPSDIYTEMVDASVDMAFDKGNFSIEKAFPVENRHSIFSYQDGNGDKYYWRFAYRVFSGRKDKDIQLLFPYRSPILEFENVYGKYYEMKRLMYKKTDSVIEKAVYMARSHMDRDTELVDKEMKDWLIPIQVGASLTDKSIYDLKDNSGDNISEKNGNYSEATAIYWMWKNAKKVDYIGLNHYRRHIDIGDSDWDRIIENDIDVIVTRPTFVPQGNGAFFATLVPKCDVDFFNKAVEEMAPSYSKARDTYMTARFYPPCNIYVMRYEHFMDYAKLVFDVVFRVERIYEDMGFARKDRYMGYLVEALLGIWLIEHKDKIKIAYTDMIFLEK